MTTELIVMMTGLVVAIGFALSGIKIIRPTHRAAVETFGKYTGFRSSGITWVMPIVQKLFAINITEQLVSVARQVVITKDNLNCNIDAQIYFKVGADEERLKKALYSVNNFELQIVQLAQTTLRNVVGTKEFVTVNSERGKLNSEIFDGISRQTHQWGIDVVRVELKEILPPEDVQETMNTIIKASNTKQANIDFATAAETQADGEKRAAIKTAEGMKQSKILNAEGEKEYQIKVAQGNAEAIKTVAEADAKRIELVNTAAQKYFKEQAVELKRLEVTQASLQANTKFVVTKEGIDPTLVINETEKQIIPTKGYKESAKS